MKTLVLFGNNNLQKDTITVSLTESRSTTDQITNDMSVARNDGSRVVNSRLDKKVFQIQGSLNGNTNNTLQEVSDNLDEILSDKNEHYFRLIPDYQVLCDCTSTANIVLSNDIETLAVDTKNFQLGHSALSLSTKSSLSTFNGIITYTPSAINLSNKIGTGNVEFWLYIDNSYYVSSLDFRFGSDSSNYYSQNLSIDYEGGRIHNGWNLFSIDWTASTTKTGTPDDSAIDYFLIQFNLLSGAESTDLKFGGIIYSNESQVRNFKSYRTGGVNKPFNYSNISQCNFSCQFLNSTGYAESTPYYTLFSQTNQTYNTIVNKIDLGGTLAPIPEITVNMDSASLVTGLVLQNLNNLESTAVTTTLTANDQFVFGGQNFTCTKNGTNVDFTGVIPSFKLGVNNLQIGFSTLANIENIPTTSITGTTLVSQYTVGDYMAQSFTTGTSGFPVTEVQFYAYQTTNTTYNFDAQIFTDSGGNPGSQVVSIAQNFNLPFSMSLVSIPNLNVALSNSTKYWLRFHIGSNQYSWENRKHIFQSASDGTQYANETAKILTYPAGVWTDLGLDLKFRVIRSGVLSLQYDWSARYKKLYLS